MQKTNDKELFKTINSEKFTAVVVDVLDDMGLLFANPYGVMFEALDTLKENESVITHCSIFEYDQCGNFCHSGYCNAGS